MFPMDALKAVFSENKISKKIDLEKVLQSLNEPFVKNEKDLVNAK